MNARSTPADAAAGTAWFAFAPSGAGTAATTASSWWHACHFAGLSTGYSSTATTGTPAAAARHAEPIALSRRVTLSLGCVAVGLGYSASMLSTISAGDASLRSPAASVKRGLQLAIRARFKRAFISAW